MGTKRRSLPCLSNETAAKDAAANRRVLALVSSLVPVNLNSDSPTKRGA